MAETSKPSARIRVGSCVLAAFYVGVFYVMGNAASVEAGIYRDFNARLNWMEKILPGLTPGIGLTLGLMVAAVLVAKDRKLAPSDSKNWNNRAAGALALLAALGLGWLLFPHGGLHDIIQ